MKKLLLLGIVAMGLFAARYPIIMEYYYMSSCVNAGKNKNKDKMTAYCACTLNEIEKNYTLNEFISNMQQDKNEFLKEVMKKAVPKCIDKLTN